MSKTTFQNQQILDKSSEARFGGGAARIADQHRKGKLTARERLEVLLDPDSFQETGMFVEHRCNNFGMEDKNLQVMALLPDTEQLMADWCLFIVRISPFLAVH